jgi:hypothetical protein
MSYLLFGERQGARDLSNRRAIGGWADADGHGLTSELASILDDELVRQGLLTERFGNAHERSLIGHCKRDDDRRRVARGFARGMGYLGDLRTVGEISPD